MLHNLINIRASLIACGFISFLLVILSNPVCAKMYKWIDADGITHYSAIRPLNTDAKMITTPDMQSDQHDKSMKSVEDKSSIPAVITDSDEEKTKKSASLAAKKAKHCAQARLNLKMLLKPTSFIKKKVKGELVGISESDKTTLMLKQKEYINSFCAKI